MKTEVRRPFETTWEDWVLGGGAPASFADPSLPLEVEIGPGDDDFLILCAERYPDRNWLGIEYSRKRVHRYARRIQGRLGEVGNLRLIWRPAGDLVRPFLSPARVDTYHVYFPDPWPKKHHHRYRLLHAGFLADVAESLVPGGRFLLLTDHAEYAAEVVEEAGRVDGLVNACPAPGYELVEAGDRRTPFEERWRERGLAIHRIELNRPT